MSVNYSPIVKVDAVDDNSSSDTDFQTNLCYRSEIISSQMTKTNLQELTSVNNSSRF